MNDVLNYGYNLSDVKNKVASDEGVYTLYNALYRHDLLGNTVYKSNIGEGWGAWRLIADILDEYFLKNNIHIEFNESDLNFFVNCSVFYSESMNYISDLRLIKMLNKLHNNQLVFFFNRINNLHRIKKILQLGVGFIFSENAFLQFLLASCVFKCLSKDEEIHIIKEYLKANKVSNLFSNVLTTRCNALSIEKTIKESNKDKKNLSILVSGQLRGAERSVKVFHDKLDKTDVIIDDYLVSTWGQRGKPRIIPQFYYRLFENDAAEYFNAHQSEGLERKIHEYFDGSDTITYEKLSSIFDVTSMSSSRNIEKPKVYLNDSNIYPYNKMSNHEKMYFHNALLNDELIKSNDNLVLKIRPDYMFMNDEKFNLDLNYNNTIYADFPFIYEAWGFGMGDQLWLGLNDTISVILNCHSRDSLSHLIVKNMFSSIDGYKGHINCGLEAWINGIDVKAVDQNMKSRGLSSQLLINLDTLKEMQDSL